MDKLASLEPIDASVTSICVRVFEVYESDDRERLSRVFRELLGEPINHHTVRTGVGMGIRSTSGQEASDEEDEQVLAEVTTWTLKGQDINLLAGTDDVDDLVDSELPSGSHGSSLEADLSAIQEVEVLLVKAQEFPAVSLHFLITVDPESVELGEQLSADLDSIGRPFRVFLEATGGITRGPIVSPRVPMVAVVDVDAADRKVEDLSRAVIEGVDVAGVTEQAIPFLPTDESVGIESHIPGGRSYAVFGNLVQPALGGLRSLYLLRFNAGSADIPAHPIHEYFHVPANPGDLLAFWEDAALVWLVILDVWLEHVQETMSSIEREMNQTISRPKSGKGVREGASPDERELLTLGSRTAQLLIDIGTVERYIGASLQKYPSDGPLVAPEVGVARGSTSTQIPIRSGEDGLLANRVAHIRRALANVQSAGEQVVKELETMSRFESIRTQRTMQLLQIGLTGTLIFLAVAQLMIAWEQFGGWGRSMIAVAVVIVLGLLLWIRNELRA